MSSIRLFVSSIRLFVSSIRLFSSLFRSSLRLFVAPSYRLMLVIRMRAVAMVTPTTVTVEPTIDAMIAAVSLMIAAVSLILASRYHGVFQPAPVGRLSLSCSRAEPVSAWSVSQRIWIVQRN